MTTVVIGGGIAGLAAAWELRQTIAAEDIVVLEAADRFGGKIKTTAFAGRPVDEGADAFLARVPYAVELAREVGLGDLVSPTTGQASLWVGGELKAIPGGHVLGVPTDMDLVAKSGILSDAGVERARAEPDVPGAPLGPTEDVAVGELVARRYGQEVQDYLVDPLLGGINAGRSDELSAEVGAAQIVAAARRDASLTRGLLAMRAENPPDPSAPVFWAPRGGMQRLVDTLAAALVDRGVALRGGSPVTHIERDGGGYVIGIEDQLDPVRAERVVLATPAFVSADLLARLSPEAAGVLSDVAYASVALITLAYPRAAFAEPPAGSGFLVPRVEGRFLTAGSIFSNKWSALADPDLVIIRASAGRIDDDGPVELPDDELVARVHAELAEALLVSEPPAEVRISRWRRAFPQFAAGHLARMATVHERLAADAPGTAIAGAAVQGVGIPSCILSAKEAVARIT